MTAPMQEYLERKRTVDDRALNRRVLEQFGDDLATRAGTEFSGGRADRRGSVDAAEFDPIRIVELGAGIGTMIARLASWDVLPARVSYRAVDRDPESIAYAYEHVPRWLEDAGYEVTKVTDGAAERGRRVLSARSAHRRLEVTLEVADAFSITDDADAVIAAAFLDIVDLEAAIPSILELVDTGGSLYAPITFDGATTFAPELPADDRIEVLYHRHMDELRALPGGSRAGRELLTSLPAFGVDVRSVGGSDWIVRPVDGGYPGSERAFLADILETINGALTDYPSTEVDPELRRTWLERRRRHLERDELVFVAHNLDVLGRA